MFERAGWAGELRRGIDPLQQHDQNQSYRFVAYLAAMRFEYVIGRENRSTRY